MKSSTATKKKPSKFSQNPHSSSPLRCQRSRTSSSRKKLRHSNSNPAWTSNLRKRWNKRANKERQKKELATPILDIAPWWICTARSSISNSQTLIAIRNPLLTVSNTCNTASRPNLNNISKCTNMSAASVQKFLIQVFNLVPLVIRFQKLQI